MSLCEKKYKKVVIEFQISDHKIISRSFSYVGYRTMEKIKM